MSGDKIFTNVLPFFSQLCFEQDCISVSQLGVQSCGTGSNGQTCSGNGVSAWDMLNCVGLGYKYMCMLYIM